MATIKAVIKALEQSLETNDFNEFIRLIKSDVKVINKVFQKNNIKLLHKLCSINITQLRAHNDDSDNSAPTVTVTEKDYLDMLEKLFDEIDFDFNVTDANGDTPLHYAIYTNNKPMVELLLKYEDVNTRQTNHSGETPLEIASENNFVDIEKCLREDSDSTNQSDDTAIPDNMTIKEYQRHQKESIINLGPLRAMATDNEKQIAYQSLESTLYFENPQLKEKFHNVLKKAIDNPILESMITMLGLCAARGTIEEVRKKTLFDTLSQLTHLKENLDISDKEYEEAIKPIQKQLGKKFKIICIDAPDVTTLKPFVAEARGLYSNKNTIFIATKKLPVNEILSVMMHESSHFIMNQLFQNTSNPYPPGEKNNPLKTTFLRIVNQVKNNLEKNKENINLKEDVAYAIINNVFTKYNKSEWPSELIVRVPQIIAHLGNHHGQQWLEKNTPELLHYYQKEIIPRINNYLEDQKASLYLSGLDEKKPASTKKY